MRHGRTINKLGMESSHRNAMLSNMASSLILHKRINTTLAKGKVLRKFVEPLLTKSKEDTTHSRRVVFSYLGDKVAVTELFREISKKIMDRPGGYTRILKTGFRKGDNAETCLVELVDFNETYTDKKVKEDKKAKTTRRSKGTAKKKAADAGDNAAEENIQMSAEENVNTTDAAVEAKPKKKAAKKKTEDTDTAKEE